MFETAQNGSKWIFWPDSRCRRGGGTAFVGILPRKTPLRMLALALCVHILPRLREQIAHIPDQDLESSKSIFSPTLTGVWYSVIFRIFCAFWLLQTSCHVLCVCYEVCGSGTGRNSGHGTYFHAPDASESHLSYFLRTCTVKSLFSHLCNF